jgi:hypothetical protein
VRDAWSRLYDDEVVEKVSQMKGFNVVSWLSGHRIYPKRSSIIFRRRGSTRLRNPTLFRLLYSCQLPS